MWRISSQDWIYIRNGWLEMTARQGECCEWRDNDEMKTTTIEAENGEWPLWWFGLVDFKVGKKRHKMGWIYVENWRYHPNARRSRAANLPLLLILSTDCEKWRMWRQLYPGRTRIAKTCGWAVNTPQIIGLHFSYVRCGLKKGAKWLLIRKSLRTHNKNQFFWLLTYNYTYLRWSFS